MADETAAQRFVRDWTTAAALNADRKHRGLNMQSAERLAREYVAPNGSTPADDEIGV